MTNFDRI